MKISYSVGFVRCIVEELVQVRQGLLNLESCWGGEIPFQCQRSCLWSMMFFVLIEK